MWKRGAAACLGSAAAFLPARADGPQDYGRYFRLPAAGPSGSPVLEDAPKSIVEDGRIATGLFKTPVRHMNLLDSRILHGKATCWLGLPRLLEWIGAGMAHPDWYFGFIIVDAKSAHLSVLYGYNRKTGALFSHDSLGPSRQVRVAESLWNDSTRVEKSGFSMSVLHRLEKGFHQVSIDIKESAQGPPVRGNLTWHEDLEKTQPLVMMSQLDGLHFVYNHKAQMPIEGSMKIGGEEAVFDPLRDLANLGEVRSHSGLKNHYNWFNFGGFNREGRVVGLNALSSRQRPEHSWTENCMWVGDTLSMVGPVHFEVDPRNIMQPWRAYDKAGRVDVTFHPEGGKSIMLGFLGRYHQKCGCFRGTLIDDAGEHHEVTDYYGCAESMAVF